jgi:signal transduction histidine kinase
VARHQAILTYVVAYLAAIGTALRYLTAYGGKPVQWTVLSLLVAFFLLLAIEPWISRRSHRCTHLYLALQTGILVALASIPPHLDYFATLYLVLVMQAAYVYPARVALRWTAAYTAIVAGILFHTQGWSRGLPSVLMLTILYLFVGSYAAIARRVETARSESQRLLQKLRTAHRQLQAQARQTEELAVVEERNRLARSLHDSVTQTLFSMTLIAEAARILFDRDPARAALQLDKLQELAKSALGELRSLIYELRPVEAPPSIGEQTHG